jgi:A nuclease family of the HNH/ENDO VII superfamily with conserved AHH
VSELSPEERAELEKEYNITTRGEENRPVFTRHQPKEDHAPIHAEKENGEWVIKKGLEQNNSRLSNPYAMDKNFEAEYGPKPKDHQTHHLVPDQTYQQNELTAELVRRDESGLDDASNLIAQPNGAEAFNDESPEVRALEDKEALAEIVHNGSHPEWNKHADKLLDKKVETLLDKNPGKTLQEIPTEELKQAEQSVMQQLRQELRDAAQQIKEGHPENLPAWIKPDYIPKDGNGQEFPKISEVPQQIPANTLEASRNSTGATLANNTETQQPNVDSATSEDQQFNDSIAEKIRASRERYPLPQPRTPQALNTTIADQHDSTQSPRKSLDSIKENNPSLHDTLSRLNNVIDELDKQTLARQPRSSPAQRLYEKTAQSVTQQTGLTPSHDRFEPVLAAKLLAEHGYHQAASIIAAGSPTLNEVNANFGSTTADRQLAELMKEGQQTLQAMRPEQQKQQDQMEQG